MDEFGERLKIERSRLGLSQSDFAALGGVKQHAQFQYEKSMRRPNSEYLEALAAEGVDVWYLLTGEPASLIGGEDERRVVSAFRNLDARQREALLLFIEAFTGPPEP